MPPNGSRRGDRLRDVRPAAPPGLGCRSCRGARLRRCRAVERRAGDRRDGEGRRQLRGAGFATDPHPKGSNIRSLPRADAPIIGHLPPRFALTPGDLVGAEFDIIGSKGGWLLIRNAEAVVDTRGKGKRVFKGPGWISGGLAGAMLGSQILRAEPRRDAAIVASLLDADKGWGPDSFAVMRIHACQGDFVEVTLRSPQIPSEPEKLLRGWSARPCSNQLTTCDRGE
jgi:hypothetical protein